MPSAVGPITADVNVASTIRTPVEAAKAFETLMLKQLMKSMSKTIGNSGLFGKGFEGELYSDMFSEAVAEAAATGESGLSGMIMEALNVDERSADTLRSIGRNAVRGISAYKAMVQGEAAAPENSQLEAVVKEWMDPYRAHRWGKEGVLETSDLGAKLETEGVGGTARFNVNDAEGYRDYPKCNLFAFEMLRRAGYAVPVRARSHGWGYPGAESTTRRAANNTTEGWAIPRTAESAESLDTAASSGTPLLLTSSAPEERAGHMAVADRIHNIQRDAAGNIATIEYSGWEAGSRRAGYGRRVWRLQGIEGSGRGGLDRIEVLEPLSASNNGTYHRVDSGKPGASIRDN
jgi:Rod binding domain-containing protein